MPLSSFSELEQVQRHTQSVVNTNELFYPKGLKRDVVHRLEESRLVFNARHWVSFPLEPILAAEVPNGCNLWEPAVLRDSLRDVQHIVAVSDYLHFYERFYKYAKFYKYTKESVFYSKRSYLGKTPSPHPPPPSLPVVHLTHLTSFCLPKIKKK